MEQDRLDLVKKIAAKLATIELSLWKARHDMLAMESLVMQGRKLDMVGGDDCLDLIMRFGSVAGEIAGIEQEVYRIHAGLTVIAQSQGVDVGGPYAVLKGHMPDVDTKSGGGRR